MKTNEKLNENNEFKGKGYTPEKGFGNLKMMLCVFTNMCWLFLRH